jgi:hypothetical protein
MVDCREFVGRKGREGREGVHRKRRGEFDHRDGHENDSNRVRDRVAEDLAAYLAHRPRFEFEALLEELEGADRDRSPRNAREFERGWRSVARFTATHLDEHNDTSRGAAIHYSGDNGPVYSWDFTGLFDSQRSVGGLLQRAVHLQTFLGLEDGFRQLHR